VIAGRNEAPSAEDVKTPSGIRKLKPDKSLMRMPPPPQSNACGQVTDRRDRRDRRVDTYVLACLFPLILKMPTPRRVGCVLF